MDFPASGQAELPRILMETTALSRPGADRGIGRYLRTLESSLLRSGFRVSHFEKQMSAGRVAEFTAVVPRQITLRRHRHSVDVLHVASPFYMGSAPGLPVVASILDLIPLDLTEHVRTGVKAKLFHRWAARADTILTISDFSRNRIVEVLNVDPSKVFVARLPPEPTFGPDGPAHDEGRPYVAAMIDVRTPDPRKRGEWLRVLADRLEGEGLQLLLVGGGTEKLAWPNTHGLGRISDEQWARVLRGARAFAYCSKYEGQGLPPLEALACGVPVVAMDNSAVREIVVGGGILVDETRGVDGFVSAVVELAQNVPVDGSAQAMRAAARCSPTAFDDGVLRAHLAAVGVDS